ncbi:MAG: hypothetical protein FWG77_05775 [Treponema sp.]|nr:hypothetical protein [Treponema sp.]
MKISSKQIKEKANELGFLACGVIKANIFDDYKENLDKRIKSFPNSAKLHESLFNIVKQGDDAKSIIVFTQRHNMYKVPASLNNVIGKVYQMDPRVSYSREQQKNALFEDWLKLKGIKILPSGVPVRLAAAKAGLGKIGRNNFFYDLKHGSYVWINARVVDKELEYDSIEEDIALSSCNDECQNCVSSCPTNALSNAFSMDRSRCITHLTCFEQTSINKDTLSRMGSWLYGCDVCQDSCPFNKDKFNGSEDYPLLSEFEEYLTPDRIIGMDEETYQNTVNPRFWYMGKDNLWQWKRNALRAMINSSDKKYHSIIKEHANHGDQRIREIAQWGIEKLLI